MVEGADTGIKLELHGQTDLGIVASIAHNLEIVLQDIEQSLTGIEPQATWTWEGATAVRAVASANGTDLETLQNIVHDTREGFRRAEEADRVRVQWPATLGRRARKAISEIMGQLEQLDAITVDVKDQEPLTLRKLERPLTIERAKLHKEHSAVDGMLDLISVRTGVRFSVREHGTGHVVRCTIREDMLDKAKDALGKRVVVEGTVRYRQDGVPSWITDISDIWIRPQELRPIEELAGTLPDLSKGLPAGEFIRRLREGNGEENNG